MLFFFFFWDMMTYIVKFQASGTDKTVIAFMIFPAKTNNFNIESLRGQAVTKSLRDAIHDIQSKIGKRMYDICLT